MVTESGSPLKQTFPVPSSPLPVINLEHKEGAITGEKTITQPLLFLYSTLSRSGIIFATTSIYCRKVVIHDIHLTIFQCELPRAICWQSWTHCAWRTTSAMLRSASTERSSTRTEWCSQPPGMGRNEVFFVRFFETVRYGGVSVNLKLVLENAPVSYFQLVSNTSFGVVMTFCQKIFLKSDDLWSLKVVRSADGNREVKVQRKLL